MQSLRDCWVRFARSVVCFGLGSNKAHGGRRRRGHRHQQHRGSHLRRRRHVTATATSNAVVVTVAEILDVAVDAPDPANIAVSAGATQQEIVLP